MFDKIDQSNESFHSDELIKVHLVNGTSNLIRFNELTDIELVISLLTNRLSSDGLDRALKSLFAIRVIKYPENRDQNAEFSEIIWLDNESSINNLIKKYNLNIDTSRFELRIRFFPYTFQEILEKDRVTFYYLYDQVKNDYFQTKKAIDQDVAINLSCLEIRRFFKDFKDYQFALDKKSNFDTLEKEIGLHKFLHSSIISTVKPKVLRKLIQNQFKKVLNLDDQQCMTKFLDIVDGILHFKTEEYKCEFKIFIHYLPVQLVCGSEIGISYITDKTSAPTHQMTSLQQIEHFQTLIFKEVPTNLELSSNFIHDTKCILQIKIFGADELLSIICSSVIEVENIALLIDGYCKFLFKKIDSLWINKYNNFCAKEIENTQQPKLKKQATYDNEEKDYAEIVEDDYTMPNAKINYVNRSQVKLINLIGNGHFAEVYRGILKDELGDETEVAVKTCKKENENNLSDKFLEEALVLQQFQHDFIIRLIGVCSSSPILILMELAKFGELRQFLQTNRSTIDFSTLILYSYQLSTALSYLEEKNIVHRDLAARNVLVCSFDCVKLSDFGLSRLIQDYSYYKASNCKLPIKWMSPESINFRKFTKSSDIWSFAVLIWEILSYGVKPFEGVKNSVVIHKIENGERLPLPEICPPNLFNLLLHCWRYEPSERPNIKQIKSFLYDLLNSITSSEQDEEEIFDNEFKKSLLEIKLKSQEKQSIEDAQWLEKEEKEMFGSCQQFSSSDNQSIKSETASLSSNNPFLDACDQIDKSDTLQNLNSINSCSSLSKSSLIELNREDDEVYKYTTKVSMNVKQLLDYVSRTEVDSYVDKIKEIGVELRNLLATVDSLIETVPECYHTEINMAHRILSKDFATLIDSIKQVQKYSDTTIEHQFKKKVFKSAHILVINSKTLLDTIDSVKLKIANQQNDQVLVDDE